MAKTQDIARSMAAAPLHSSSNDEQPKADVSMENNPLIFSPGFGAPVFSRSQAKPYENPKSKVITTEIADVRIPILGCEGASLRAVVVRKATPATQDGATGYNVSTELQTGSIGPFFRQLHSLSTDTPEAESKLNIWRYHVVTAAEKWAETQENISDGTKAVTSNLPRLVKFVATPVKA